LTATTCGSFHLSNERLADLLFQLKDNRLKLSESFDDAGKVLEAAERMKWQEANRDRYKLFEKA
jgi:hypothetical protein